MRTVAGIVSFFRGGALNHRRFQNQVSCLCSKFTWRGETVWHFPFTRELCGEDEEGMEHARQVLACVLASLLTIFNEQFVHFASFDDVCCF